MALARAQLSQLAIRYNRTKVVNFLPPPLILWLAVAAVVVLLAPYAGVHILTSPPAVEEQRATLNLRQLSQQRKDDPSQFGLRPRRHA